MPDIESVRERKKAADERLREKTDALDEATGSRDEAEQELRRLRARKDRVREEAKARDLIPGTDPEAAVAMAEDETEQLDQRIREIDTRIERARREKQQAREEQQEAAKALFKALATPLLAAREEETEALDAIGWAAVAHYRELLEARGKREEIRVEAKRALSTAAPSSRQRRELKGWIQEQAPDPAPAALLGALMVDLLSWTRRIDRGPLPEWLREEGISGREGSPRHAQPIPAVEQVIAALERGDLPGPVFNL